VEQTGNILIDPFHSTEFAMSAIHRVHTALFDELERQGILSADVGRLTVAVMKARIAIQAQARPMTSSPRCANGACDE
jgi:hypothetical protein